MRSQAVIFDMDGVLVDSEPLHLVSTNVVLGRFGHGLSAEENEIYLGWNEQSYWSALLERFGIDAAIEDCIAEREAEILRLFHEEVPVAPGVVDFVHALRDRGIPRAVASSSDRRVIDAVLERSGLAGSFDAIASGDEVSRSKPDPEIFLLAASRLGVEPERCLVFEDAPHGAQGALSAGMRCIRVVTQTTRRLSFPRVDKDIEGFQGLGVDDVLGAESQS